IAKLWRLSRLRNQYNQALAAQLPDVQQAVSISFFHFMFCDLENYLRAEIADPAARQGLAAAQPTHEADNHALEGDLQDSREQLQLTPEHAVRVATVVTSGSLDEWRRLRESYRPLSEQKIAQMEREQQKIPERQTETHPLESVFEALPLEKRENEAR